MPPLLNPMHEAFARAKAKGASGAAAEREAGYRPGNCWKLSKRKHVKARVEELTEEFRWGEPADLPPVIAELLRLATKAGGMDSPAGLMAARSLLAEAARLKRLLPRTHTIRAPLPPLMTTEEWIAQLPPRT